MGGAELATGAYTIKALGADTWDDFEALAGRHTFLYNGTRSMFEDAAFRYDRPKGKFNCVMITTVPPASPPA